MRKAQKKQAEEFVLLLSQAHEEIQNFIESDNAEGAMELLGQCQEGAVELGNLIEATEGDQAPTIALLEQYCELVYGIHQQISGGQQISAQGVYDTLHSRLQKINRSVQNDIPIRREVVFLPYKASMWDSLESVYKATAEDENCDAYVIPIPYYDKNPDGSFKTLHYEGDQFPEDIPITDFNEYAFADRQPDMIFIHNPYDGNNFVTSVHPFFYSDKLKQYTEKLVYIPYFVLAEVNMEDEKAVERLKGFCLMPGVLNADKVIVQSERMRDAYITVLTEHFGEQTRSLWENRILGTGSPKLDKAAKARREDMEIPEAWKKIIYRPDGSRKKIMLYNTTITAFLEHNEKMLEKIQDTFRICREKQDDIAFLRRPHPLMQATIESMRPRLWQAYMQLVQQYRLEGWGIYDDTADLDRALAISDAYYGDPSSLVQLCQERRMPIMIQNVDI